MSFLISNNTGSFALFGIKSRYQGVFFKHGDKLFRTIAHIEAEGSPGALTGELWKVTRDRDNLSESFWFVHNLPIFFYELSKHSKVDIFFDCKENFDNRVWGRNYGFDNESGALLVHFEKRNDSREAEGNECDFWLALFGCELEIVNEWEEVNYTYDKLRNSLPYARWVLQGCKAHGSFVLAFADNKDDALKLAITSWKKKQQLALESELYASEVIAGNQFKDDDVQTAVECAKYSLACLHENHGLYAGLPWFTQRWACDELISVKGLMLSHQETLAKVILFSWLDKLADGKLPGTLTKSIADVGWLFARLEEYDFSDKEAKQVAKKLEAFLKHVEANLQNGLVVNNSKETWMDSLDRSGARIEIQALTLAAYKLLRVVGKGNPYEEKLRDAVKKAFWKGNCLADGSNDDTIRPNIFIAAYVYPELLSKKEWIDCFDHILPKLWLKWGGLSTIDTSHSDFVSKHTGENPTSYHNGDSWFWINNLAAIVLHAFGPKKYKEYIDKILQASTHDILYEGVMSHASELSSASELKPAGSPVQAWSAATYIELAEELSER